MRGGVAIQGDHLRGSMLFRRPGKESLSGDHITPFAQEKVDGVALFVDGAIQVHPLTTDLDISLIYAPGVADRPRITAPALFEFRDIPLNPPQNGRMGQGDAAGVFPVRDESLLYAQGRIETKRRKETLHAL